LSRYTPRRFVGRWLAAVVLVPVLWAVTVHPPYSNSPPIRSDGLGYHAWTRAFVQRDFTFCKWPELRPTGTITAVVDGHCVEKYPYGLALLRLPVMGPLVDRSPGAPLVSHAEHRANQYLSALALLLVVGFATATLLLLGVEGVFAQAGILAVVFGTGLFHYSTYDASFTHVYSAALAAALLWLSVRAAVRGGRPPPAVAVFVLAFLAVAVRSTNVVLVLATVGAVGGWSVLRAGGPGAWPQVGRAEAERLAWWVGPALAGAVAATLAEGLYLLYATGRFNLSGYGQESFLFNRPMQRSVLLSYERGLFTWYPVVAVVLAVGLLVRRTRLAALGLSGLVVLYTGIYGFWASWYLGGGFGHRGFIDMAPLAMVLFGVALAALPRPRRALALGAAGLCALATLSLMAGYWQGTVGFGGTPASVYWAHLTGAENLYWRWLAR
jgi:hypothetical protein